ncbi:hypothetical protein ACVRXQ_11840 [Streptococcus panodentis]|uniref:Uncharacterized protein n=1 Tax=Streptococcus panodentis TaxID=1581472 RepID=A0ABS5AZ81_9STRE|nr:hypothetical protein [Streptococcus panodentis]
MTEMKTGRIKLLVFFVFLKLNTQWKLSADRIAAICRVKNFLPKQSEAETLLPQPPYPQPLTV